jgi:hypothetical protein
VSSAANPTATGVKVTASPHDPLAGRFQIAVEQCVVDDKKRLVRYRTYWTKWMSWYRYNTSEPHSIESQIHQMLFSDLTYRAIVSVRELDRGYLFSQVLSLQKLLDDRKDVISSSDF